LAAGCRLHTVAAGTDEGRRLAGLFPMLNEKHGLGLGVRVVHKEHINDDDGMFIRSGFRTTVMNTGSFPNADSEYHMPGDRPERVDIENLAMSTRLVLAAVLELDARGTEALPA
jgi:hypothetical protein